MRREKQLLVETHGWVPPTHARLGLGIEPTTKKRALVRELNREPLGHRLML